LILVLKEIQSLQENASKTSRSQVVLDARAIEIGEGRFEIF